MDTNLDLPYSADGDYTVTIMTKATLTYTGDVQWSPPAIFKSQCDIDVEYFPFDTQVCKLIFLPWSHDGTKVQYNGRICVCVSCMVVRTV